MTLSEENLREILLERAYKKGINLSDRDVTRAVSDLRRWTSKGFPRDGAVRTADGTYTLIHGEFGEPYHSLSAGAVRECIEKFIKPAALIDKVEHSQEINILDIGFGLGYNVAVAIALTRKVNPSIRINVISFDKEIPESIPLLEDEFGRYQRLLLTDRDRLLREGINFNLLMGDARKSIRGVREFRADVAFHDAFSPYKNPELWTLDFMKEVRRLMKPEGVWVSYTSALCVRRALLELGFGIKGSIPVGRRRGGTLASCMWSGYELPESEGEKLKTSPYACPMRDENLNEERINILIDYRLDVILRERELSSELRRGL